MNVIPWSKYQNENTSKIYKKINRKKQVGGFGMVSNYSHQIYVCQKDIIINGNIVINAEVNEDFMIYK